MPSYSTEDISKVRFERAEECLEAARQNMELQDFKTAANRSYYAVFHSMRAVLAFDKFDSKKHSGVISEFRRRYIKTGLLPEELSPIITKLFIVRGSSDYEDFFVISKEEVTEQYQNAVKFVEAIKAYLKRRE